MHTSTKGKHQLKLVPFFRLRWHSGREYGAPHWVEHFPALIKANSPLFRGIVPEMFTACSFREAEAISSGHFIHHQNQ
jgi:hypothetical protein